MGTPNENPRHAFSRREREVLRLGAQGATDQDISERLAIAVPTLRTYWLRIREKLGAVNRTHAIALAVAGPLSTEDGTDPHRRLLQEARAQSVAHWAWRPADRKVLLEGPTMDLFSLSSGESALSLDRFLDAVWTPDRPRLERFLTQSADLTPMTPIEHRIGASGDYRQTVRTVNLSTHRSRQDGVTVLLASAPGRILS